MSVNRYKPHIFILPEDDANRQLAVGFALEVDSRQVYVLDEAGGWLSACSSFERDHVQDMRNCPQRFMIFLIDFDEDAERRQCVRAKIPSDLADRVFIIGSFNEPEDLRRDLSKPYEQIGRTVARDCRHQNRTILESVLLRHNTEEIGRICAIFSMIS